MALASPRRGPLRNNMNIIIPTFRRPNTQLTWNTLHPNIRRFVTFVVRPDEAPFFRSSYAPSSVVETDGTVHDFSSTMQFLFDAFCHTKFIYIDDDVTALYRRRRFYEDISTLEKPFAVTKLETAEDQSQMFDSMLTDLETPHVGNVGLRPAYLPPYADKYRHAQSNIQLMAVDGALVKRIGARWDRLKWCSDNDFNLQLNYHGLDTLQRNDFYYTTPDFFEGAGGSNSEITAEARRVETHEHLKTLASMWPGVIFPTTRKGQTGRYVSGFVARRKKHLERRRRELGLPPL